MKRIGIVCDNYKVDEFEKALKQADFFFSKKPFMKKTTAIFIMCHESRIDEIAKICKKIEIDFKLSN